ncbi:MAG: glycogen synthase GlgA [Ignavibacteriae bacterium HGW-Ignavibacteriae-3]|nr:MAG: glycogen synthase GlgA [Ignavibacteriae bacterium HGW-Ignavibacteriae-3]
MKIAFASSEVFPYAKTGGLGDVAGSLPIELSRLGHDVKVFMPKYNTFGEAEFGLHYNWDIGEIPVRIDGQVRMVHVHTATMPDSNVQIYFVDCPHYFHRFRVYTNDHDEDERFILFSKGIIEILQRLQWAPDIIHCNDWQTGLLPILLKENYSWDRMFDKTSTVLTMHNIAYQGRFAKSAFHKAEIKEEHSGANGIGEYEGDVNFLKTGILTSDVINTVSETYEKELMTAEYGNGMEPFLAARFNDFYGILNGVDYSVWNPETDKLIPYNYSISDLSGKEKNKKFLLERLELPYNENLPLIGIISRLVDQKGFDIVAYGINQLLDIEAQWVILGSGEEKYESLFYEAGKRFPEKVSTYLGYNNELSHLIEAGADIFLMPSKFEPCGLNQIYSLKYGTVPVVRKTGGLADTVQDWNEYLARGSETGNGFSFNDHSAFAMVHSVKRSLIDFHNKPTWLKIQRNGMNKDYSWRKSAEKYTALYEKAVVKRTGR